MSQDQTNAPADAAPSSTEPPHADFAALDEQAHQLDGSANPDAPQRPQAPAADNAAELRAALEMARLMVRPMFAWWPQFDEVWSDRTIDGIATGGGAVMDKHGWTMGGALAEFGPYIALAGATIPPCIVTMQAIKQRKQEAAHVRGAEQAAD